MAQLLTFANFNDFHRHNVRYMEAHFYVFFHVFKLIERLERKEEGVYNAYNITDDNGRTIIAILVGGAYYLYSSGWTPEMLELLANQVDVAKCKTGFQFLGQRDLIAEVLNNYHAKWQVIKDRLIYTCQQVANKPEKSHAVVQNAALHDVYRLIELTIDYGREEYPAKLKRDEAKAYAQVMYGIESNNMFVVKHNGKICSILQVIQTDSYDRPVIGSLYTIPSARNKGFAALLLRTVTDGLLKNGSGECGLVSDVTNPASNKAFINVGYQPIYEWLNAVIE
jgi:GNAT superfamily N-acetyltransferase